MHLLKYSTAALLPSVVASTAGHREILFNHVGSGPFSLIYNATVGEAQPWYINDHTLIQDTNGTWHFFGITHPEPADPVNEHVFAHSTASELHGPWTKQPFALHLDRSYGETHLWAPHVIHHDGIYWMFYCGGGEDLTAYEINLATSTDLFHWKRHPEGPLFRDGYEARDPMVTRIGDEWVMYYCGNSDPSGGNHAVLYRTSKDLVNWSGRKFAFMDPTIGTGGGVTESPFVLQHSGLWYLFIGPRPSQEVYIGTDVFVSRDPFHFTAEGRVRHIGSHAAEVVRDENGWWVSHCGWGQGGVYLAELYWE
jgi:arabinan endo-1,5-alpha-L-arabinosidase